MINAFRAAKFLFDTAEIIEALHGTQKARDFNQVRKYDPNQPRVPAGDPEGGQWTDGGGGAGAIAGLLPSPERAVGDLPHPQADRRVLDVGGDQWNRETAHRLEGQYQTAKPKLERLAQDAMAGNTAVKVPNSQPQEWDELSEEEQSTAETAYKDAHLSSEMEYQQQSWMENSGPEEARGELVKDGTSASGKYKGEEWLRESIAQEYARREEEGEEPFPYTEEQIYRATNISADGTISFSDSNLGEPIGYDPNQMDLPLTGTATPSDALTSKMREDLEIAIKPAYDEAYEDVLNNLEVPSYVGEDAQNSVNEMWDGLGDSEKFQYAKDNIDIADRDEEDFSGDEPVRMPVKFEPITMGAGHSAEGYRETKKLATFLSRARALQIINERGLVAQDSEGSAIGPVSAVDLEEADDRAWRSWKESSTSPNGLAMQAAAAEEFGGRFRLPKGYDLEDIKSAANRSFRRIGGFAGLKAYLRGKWEATQYVLEKADIPDIPVYRGMFLNAKDVADLPTEEVPHVHDPSWSTVYTRYPTLNVVRNGMSSTTADAEVANNWAYGSGQFDAPQKIVLRADVPRTAILSVPVYGQNVHDEKEIVVMGTAWNKWDAWRNNAPEIEDVPMAKRGGKSLDIDLLHHDMGKPNWLYAGRAAIKARDFATLRKYDPNQPRDPAGTSTGGQWTDGGAAGAVSELPEHASAARDLFRSAHKPGITAAHILETNPEAAGHIREVEERLAKMAPTDAPVGNGGFKNPDGSYTPERQALHEKILDQIFTDEAVDAATPPPGTAPVATFMGGRGGSGKSWLSRPGGPVDASKAIMLNADLIQESLPGYEGWNAALYHEEASDILNQAERTALAGRLNVIYDGTMRTEKNAAARIGLLQKAGYDLKGYYMFASPETAANRALSRFMAGGKGGRYVPLDVVLGSTTNEQSFDNLKKHFSDWEIYDNNGPTFGPKLVARKMVKSLTRELTHEDFEQDGGPATREEIAAKYGADYMQRADDRIARIQQRRSVNGAAHPDFFAMRKYGFDPNQPRDQEGQWTAMGGGGFGDEDIKALAQASEDDEVYELYHAPAERPHQIGMASFASPNVQDKDFEAAARSLDGQRQKSFESAAKDIDKQLGLGQSYTHGVVGAWSDGAENSTFTETGLDNPEALKLSAAMKGYLGRQKAVLVFSGNEQGKSAFYDMNVDRPAAEVHADLLKSGIEFHTLVPKGPQSTRVVVVDTNGSLGNAIGDFAGRNGVKATRTFGNAEFIGDQEGTGSDVEQRERALKAYESVIAASATSQYSGRSAGDVWKGIRDRWDAHLQAVKRAARDFLSARRGA